MTLNSVSSGCLVISISDEVIRSSRFDEIWRWRELKINRWSEDVLARGPQDGTSRPGTVLVLARPQQTLGAKTGRGPLKWNVWFLALNVFCTIRLKTEILWSVLFFPIFIHETHLEPEISRLIIGLWRCFWGRERGVLKFLGTRTGRGRVVFKFLGMTTGRGRVILGHPTEAWFLPWNN